MFPKKKISSEGQSVADLIRVLYLSSPNLFRPKQILNFEKFTLVMG